MLLQQCYVVTDGRCTCGKHSTVHRHVESISCTLNSKTTLCVNYFQMKKLIKKKKRQLVNHSPKRRGNTMPADSQGSPRNSQEAKVRVRHEQENLLWFFLTMHRRGRASKMSRFRTGEFEYFQQVLGYDLRQRNIAPWIVRTRQCMVSGLVDYFINGVFSSKMFAIS